jgi:hypothetical protein
LSEQVHVIIVWICWEFLDMVTEKLIEYVREHQQNYDSSHHKYSENNYKEERGSFSFYI